MRPDLPTDGIDVFRAEKHYRGRIMKSAAEKLARVINQRARRQGLGINRGHLVGSYRSCLWAHPIEVSLVGEIECVALWIVWKLEQVSSLGCVNSHQSPETVPLIVNSLARLIEIIRRLAVVLTGQS